VTGGGVLAGRAFGAATEGGGWGGGLREAGDALDAAEAELDEARGVEAAVGLDEVVESVGADITEVGGVREGADAEAV
jgi:hypothetical protein